jgi:FAD:protein FMN transferase
MGSDFELIVVENTHQSAAQRLEEGIAEIRRIERLLTEFCKDSQTEMLNREAGLSPVAVDEEMYRLIERSIHISKLTQGAFDISASVLKALYDFKGKKNIFPEASLLSEKLGVSGYRNIQLLDANRVFLKKKGMRIGFGAIGKGYAADRVKALWKSKGVRAGVINASGDLTAWGLQPEHKKWKVGIAHPTNPSHIMLWLPVENASVATSGDAEQFFVKNGIRYSHNIDPRTGHPTTGIKTVTVISNSAELSDALATAVMVMGRDSGLDMINQLPNVHCILADDRNRIFQSNKIKIHEELLAK